MLIHSIEQWYDYHTKCRIPAYQFQKVYVKDILTCSQSFFIIHLKCFQKTNAQKGEFHLLSQLAFIRGGALSKESEAKRNIVLVLRSREKSFFEANEEEIHEINVLWDCIWRLGQLSYCRRKRFNETLEI